MYRQNMNKLLIICGPTATGKTKLGIELAKKFNGEIVSADSRQVYRGMNIGTGKDIGNLKFEIYNSKSILNDKFEIGHYEIDGIKIWLLDVVKPDYKFNVADYKKCADMVLDDIWKRGKLPILVGGTGFYIKAVVDGIETMAVKPDWELREKLSNCQIDELRITLEKLDPEKLATMNESDRQNPRRLVRAIEVAKWKLEVGNGKLDMDMRNGKYEERHTSILFIGLTASNSFLYEKIDQRVEERVKDGLENEIRDLLIKGYGFKNSALGTTLAYSEWEDFLSGKASKDEIIQKWKFDEHNYARRQLTWFRKNEKIIWYDIEKQNWSLEVENVVDDWYTMNK